MGKTRLDNYIHLQLLKLGEVYTLPNPHSSTIKAWETKLYEDVTAGLDALRRYASKKGLRMKWVVRSHDQVIDITCVAIGDQSIPEPIKNFNYGKPKAVKPPEIVELEAEIARKRKKLNKWKKHKTQAGVAKLPQDLKEALVQETARKVAVLRPPAETNDTEQLLKLVRLHASGYLIQFRENDTWIDVARPTWQFPASLYRVKPVHRDIYSLLSRDCNSVVKSAFSKAALGPCDPTLVVHSIEVLPNEED